MKSEVGLPVINCCDAQRDCQRFVRVRERYPDEGRSRRRDESDNVLCYLWSVIEQLRRRKLGEVKWKVALHLGSRQANQHIIHFRTVSDPHRSLRSRTCGLILMAERDFQCIS